MLLKIPFVLGAVVIALDTTVNFYNDPSCSALPFDSVESTAYATCDAFVAFYVQYCNDYGYSDCDQITLDTCSPHQFWVDQGKTGAKLECVETLPEPTYQPTDHTCDDTYQNGDETGVDCGGPDCPACPAKCSGYSCGANYTLVEEPETVECDGNPCTSSDLETCCEKKALCSTYSGCFTGDVLIANAASTYCESTSCDTGDRSQCCTAADNCENFSFCDVETQYLKSNPQNLLCASEVCDSSDISKCCEDKADCSAYTCSSDDDLTYRENYTDFYCALRECSDTDSDDCCSTRASCSGFTCNPDLYLNKTDKAAQFCLYYICEDSDWERCCDNRKACKSDWPNEYTYDCTGSVNELDENAYCAGTECTVDDVDSCCPSSQPFCDSDACELNLSIVNTTEKCTANPCTSSDTQCCLARMSCRDFTECSSVTEWVDENAYCAGVACNSADSSVCCVPKANCTTFNSCNETSQYVNVAASCASPTCDAGDESTCCINKASCSDYDDCDLSTQLLLSKYCEMNVCDSAECCSDRANCTGFQYCSDGQKLDETAICMADSCTQADDVANCCIDLAKCDSYSCSSTEVLIINASETYCAGADCEASDNCCAAKATCGNYDCEICDELDELEYCADTSCTSSDYDTCCTRVVPQLDNSKGVIMEWNVALNGDISDSDHATITDTIANYLNIPCAWLNGSYTSSGSSFDGVFEIFVSTDGNVNAGTELESDLKEMSTINGLKAEIASNLGVSDISFSTVSLSSEPYERSSGSGSSSDGLYIGIGVGVGVVLAIGGVVAWFKFK